METREYDKNLNELRPIVDIGFDVTKHYNDYNILERDIGSNISNNIKVFIMEDKRQIQKKIKEILKSKMLITLNKKDFSSGIPSRYIEIDGPSITYEISEDRLSNLKAIIIYVSSSEMITLSKISKVINQVKRIYKDPSFLIYGLSVEGTTEIKTEIFEIEYRR